MHGNMQHLNSLLCHTNNIWGWIFIFSYTSRHPWHLHHVKFCTFPNINRDTKWPCWGKKCLLWVWCKPNKVQMDQDIIYAHCETVVCFLPWALEVITWITAGNMTTCYIPHKQSGTTISRSLHKPALTHGCGFQQRGCVEVKKVYFDVWRF